TATYGLGKLHFALSSTADNTTAVTLANAKMTIQNDGKVGIGTTIPGFNLDVYGSGVVESQIMSTNNYAAQYIKGGQSGDVRWGLFSGYPNAGDFTIRETGVANYLTVKKTTGYIGIGTTSPQNGLQINGTRNGSYQGQLLVVGNSDHAYIQIQSTAPTTKETGLQIVGDGTISAPRWTIKNPANSSDLQFSTTGTGGNALRILSTGNVGIGVTDPGNPLTVRAPGAAQKTLLTLGTDTTGYGVGYEQSIDFKWYNDSSINGRISGYESYLGGVGSGGLKFYTSQYTNPGLNTTPSMTLDSAGNVGIGTTSMGAFYEKAYILQAGSLTTSLGHPRGLGLVAKTGNVAYDFSASDHPDWYKIGLAGFAIDDSGYQATGVLGVGYGSAISGIGGKFVGKGYSTVSAYGVDAKAVCNGGTNAIGVYIEDNSGAVNNYGIYQEGSNDKNYFAGNVGIGTTGPTHALEVITDVHGASPTFAPAGYFNNIHPEMSTGVYGEGFTRGVWGVSRANNGAGFGVVGEMGNGEGCSWAMEDTSGGAVVGITNCNSGDSGVAIRARHYNALSLAYGIYSEGIYSRNYFAGYVGIGTNNPTIKLAIGDTDTGLDWASDGNLKVMTNNSERIRITSDGKVGIGITNPTHTLQLGNDDAAKTTTTTWTTTSDGRLKNVVGTYDRGLAEIMRINPIRYTYKENNALGIVVPGVHIGIIAQDVQKVIPEAITVDSTGYLHYNGDPVIWASVNAIKEQQKEIDELKNIVCQLKPDADVCKK
ncbi:MAG: tail fiber domain-containing protein, partial [Patescibacteria group bacterium]